jgi:hypothetical protein
VPSPRLARFALLSFLALGAAACVPSQAYLPKPSPPDEQAGRYEQALQGALERNDYAQLTALMQAPMTLPQRREALPWARKHTEAGASLVLPVLYAETLWRIGSNPDASSPELGYRDIAARFVLYSLIVASVDGLRCKDKDAPARHAEKIQHDDNEIIDFAADRPSYARGQLINAALELEIRSAGRRVDDAYLCRSDPNDPAPQFEPPEAWQGKLTDARAEMRQRLGKLLDERAAKAGRT